MTRAENLPRPHNSTACKMCIQKEYQIPLKAVHMTPQQNGGNAESHGCCTEPKSSRT